VIGDKRILSYHRKDNRSTVNCAFVCDQQAALFECAVKRLMTNHIDKALGRYFMDIKSFKCLNGSEVIEKGDEIGIYAPAKSDFFNNPVPENGKLMKPQGDAPFYFKEIKGDFVVRVKVRPASTYDASCIMVIQDENTWAKAAFEKSDFGTTAVVSVVTNVVSDDANGCNVTTDTVWLQVARVGNNFVIHYSLDGEKFDMVRLFSLPAGDTLKVGIEAQCPTGEGGYRYFSNLTIEEKTILNIRAGC
jgi:regulation of enolase protein 1 (concanavalin A-like superfamily)